MWAGGQLHAAAVLSLGTHCGWYGLSARLFEYDEEKILPPTGVESRNDQLVATSRYTDGALAALDIIKLLEYLWQKVKESGEISNIESGMLQRMIPQHRVRYVTTNDSTANSFYQ